jgi:hypothetical protein
MSLPSFVAVVFAADVACGQHFDIFLARPAAGAQTVVGGADVNSLVYDDVTRVFEVELGAVGGEFLALEPGVNHPNLNDPVSAYPASAAGLVPGDVLRLVEREFAVEAAIDDLFYWNGIGAVTFAPAAADFRVDGGDPLGSTAGVGGVFDDHPFIIVDSDALPGVYLASVSGAVSSAVEEFDLSAPVYLVMGSEGLITAEFLGITQEEYEMLTEEELDLALEEVIERGVAYVESALLVPEPAPVGLAAIACCVAAIGMGRRRLSSAASA